MRQLHAYLTAEETTRGYYVVIDVGRLGEKGEKLIAAKNTAAAQGKATSPIVFIDGSRRASASKL